MTKYTEVGYTASKQDDNIVSTWTLGEASVTVSFPLDETRAQQAIQDLCWLCDNLDRLVVAATEKLQDEIAAQ